MNSTLWSVLESALREQRILGPRSEELASKIEAFCEKLDQAEVATQELIGISFENGVDCIAAYFAAAKQNLVVAPLPLTLPENERLTLWNRLQVRWVLTAQGLQKISEFKNPLVWPGEIHWVMHSSGSTGIPKAIPLTWSAVQKNAYDVAELLQLKKNEIHFGSMSQCYTNGLYNSFLLPLVIGANMVITPLASALKFKDYAQLLKEFQPEIIWTNPTVLKMMHRSLNAQDLQKTRFLISCTAPLTQTDCIEAERYFQKPVLQSYGLTETLIVTIERPERSAQSEFSAGAVVGGASAIKIRGDSVLEIQNGAVTPGYVEIAGPNIKFLPTNGGESARRFVSSDLMCFNQNKDLEMIGRVSNMINVDGVKISAEQIENFLLSQPGIAQAAVVRLPFKDGRERPLAFIKSFKNQIEDSIAARDQILNHCASHLGAKARPFSLVMVDEIPLNSSGKVDRLEISKRYSALISKMAES